MPYYQKHTGVKATARGGYTVSGSSASAFGVRRRHRSYKTYDKLGNVTGGTETSGLDVNPSQLPTPPVPTNPFTGSAGAVVLLSTLLFIFATWDGVGRPIFFALWTGNVFEAGSAWRAILGAIVVIAIMGVIASQSEDAAGFLMLAVIAAWLVFIIMSTGKNGNSLTRLFDWLNPSVFGGGAFGTFGAKTSTTSTVVPNPSSGTPPPKTVNA